MRILVEDETDLSRAPLRRWARLGGLVLALATAVTVVLVPVTALAGRLADDAVHGLDGAPPLGRALRRPPEDTVVYAADGTVIARLHLSQDRVVVPLSAVPTRVRDAVLAIEDARFYRHGALDYEGILRAVAADLGSGHIREGGSTLTQQYVKQTVTGGSLTVRRKLVEAVDAVALERRLPKDRILEAYLNQVYFGDGVYGIETAAEHYFARTAGRLTLAQAAALAGTIASPARFRPTAGRAALARRNLVLERMAAVGMASPAAVAAARRQPMATHLRRQPHRFPYFLDAVERQLLGDPALDGTLGPAGSAERTRAVFEGGLRVRTTLEPARQRQAESAVAGQLPPGGPDAAVASVDPRTGAISALVGGHDFAASKVDLATGQGGAGGFPAGSSFKMFYLVAALEQGISPALTLDAPATVTVHAPECPGGYTVHNAEPGPRGRIDLAAATAASVNTWYAQLMTMVGSRRAIQVARRMGVTAPLGDYCSLVLGTENVTPLELASAYATLADGGVRCQPTAVAAIVGPDGATVAAARPACQRVLDQRVAATAVAVLRRVVGPGGTGFRAAIGRPVAGKTGTTGEYKDAWFTGFTPQLSTSVWVGHRDRQTPMAHAFHGGPVFGGTFPALIFQRYMAAALAGQPVLALPGGHEQRPLRRRVGRQTVGA